MPSNLHIEVEGLQLERSNTGFHQKLVDGIEDLLLVLAEDGRVLYSSPKSYSLLQIKPEDLVGRYISTYMNVDDIPVFLIEWKDNMASGNSWRSHHRLRRQDDSYKPFESTFKPYSNITVDDKTGSRMTTKMCLMTSRPYQISSTSLMDSFLEHYTTNIRLQNQLARLKGEAEDFYQSTISTRTAYNQDFDTMAQCATSRSDKRTATTAQSIEMSPPAPLSTSTSGSSNSRKRSLSASTTSTKPQVDSVMGDMGIEIIPSRLQTMEETGAWTPKPRTKKKKPHLEQEFLCKECGTTDSPEWRKGPMGVKTLCNACGLRWSKTQKKPTTPLLNEIGSSQ